MNVPLLIALPCCFSWLSAMSSAQESASAKTADAEELFVHRVLPVFKEKCFVCHGDDLTDLNGEFNMLSRDGLLSGGESGEPSLIPGHPDDSPLVQAIRWQNSEMPPKENDRLTAEQIADVVDWVNGGAPWPDDRRIAELLRTTSDKWNAADGIAVTTSGGLSPDWTNRKYEPQNLWAYQPLWNDETGLLSAADKNPVDVLIDQRLRAMNLEAAGPTDRRTLIRRATFDLTGLPPTPGEIDAFVGDADADDPAFSKVIERLLASPHYGEQWGRHWLDVVRYADSSGYANDYERGNTWRYRDYVVRAFNDDKPYDQFIREQIAGDEIDDSNPELLIAAGFLRMGPWELTGMSVARIARQRFLDDVTDAVGQVFLGHMLQCARCHDHKFDPVPTRDYYSIQAVFATTQLTERPADFTPAENTNGFDESRYLDQRRRFYQQTLEELQKKTTIDSAFAWLKQNNVDPSAFRKFVDEITAKRGDSGNPVTVSQVRKEMAKRKIDPALIPPKQPGFEPRDFGMERVGRKGIERLRWVQDRYEPLAFSVYAGHTPKLQRVNAPLPLPADPTKSGALEQTAILVGGDPFSPSAKVTPGVLSVADRRDVDDDQSSSSGIPLSVSGRRKALAEWIASPLNPLTARVMTNRLWQWHFGTAIAGNPNNFGATGKKPSHPELLDYLAGRFIDNDWSVKSMHRLIMMSQAYRRSSQHPMPNALAAKDPAGTSYAVFAVRRLEAEELRDAMLFASGELNPAVGGIPIRPEMNLEAALQPRMVMGTFAEAWQPSPLPKQRHRRSLYALKIRGQRDPFMEVFNAPTSDLSCEARDTSTVTPQVFAMFNSEITFDRALALANRVVIDVASTDVESRTTAARHPSSFIVQPSHVIRMFRLTCGRVPSPAEITACTEHWNAMVERHRGLVFDPPDYPLEVVREAVEENTGEKFTFVEPLEVYADFVPDLKPHLASPELRALAEVCLVVLNSNEFAYLY
jgi:mono/diheme cytochrome c family protein